jgi:tRNA(Glu) U13 pseudouridine synthase TruD
VTPEPGGTQATRCFTAPRDLPHGFPPAPARGHIKRQPDDFRVEEILGFEPDGEGPHAWLWIRKRDATTQWLAGALARLAGVRRRDVGYAGLKDRAAVTSQWFSVPVEGRAEPDWGALDSPQVEVLEVTRHRKKLRRGVQAGNRFRICVQGFEGDRDALASRATSCAPGRCSARAGASAIAMRAESISRRPGPCCSTGCSRGGLLTAAGGGRFPGRR